MNKEVFIEERSKIKNELTSLRNRETELITEYIESNKEFSELQKISITSLKGIVEHGFVSRVKLNYSGNIDYELVKEKKDGTPSKHKLWVWPGSKISPRK